MIKEHPTFWIIDSTKLQDYMQCPRMYMYRYIFGWEPRDPNVHLAFGIAWHESMEHLLLNGYDAASIMNAQDAFDNAFDEHYTQFTIDEHKNKNSANAFYGLQEYAALYHDDLDLFKVIATEVAGKIAISDTKKLYFRSDAQCRGVVKHLQPGVFSLEHKTGTSLNDRWKAGWSQKIQVGTYTYLMHCMYPAEEIRGVIINGFFPHVPPKRKIDSELYANAKDVEFVRHDINKTNLQLEDWFQTVHSWYDSILIDTEAVLKVKDDERICLPFRKQTEHCTSYGTANNPGCQYKNICPAFSNPINLADTVQEGFVRRYWNPEDMLASAKEVVNIEHD